MVRSKTDADSKSHNLQNPIQKSQDRKRRNSHINIFPFQQHRTLRLLHSPNLPPLPLFLDQPHQPQPTRFPRRPLPPNPNPTLLLETLNPHHRLLPPNLPILPHHPDPPRLHLHPKPNPPLLLPTPLHPGDHQNYRHRHAKPTWAVRYLCLQGTCGWSWGY